MTEREVELGLSARDGVFAAQSSSSVPIHLVRELSELPDLTDGQKRWIEACGFKAGKKSHILLPADDGGVAAVLFGIGQGDSGEPSGPADYLVGSLATKLPAGTYRLGDGVSQPDAAALAWGLGSYAYRRFKSDTEPARRTLVVDAENADRVRTLTDAVWLGRDLINAPAGDMGPDELEMVARYVAERRAADCHVITGEGLLAENFPMIHAVGRASERAPRLIDIRWGRPDAAKVTLIGKGICFDTGGLDLKPASAMLLMKKDMGGAASALALADMIMGLGIDVRLRLLLAVAENSVGGNAFRPGDVLPTRAGFNVEIGNTDAEGRLVLADALSLADEEEQRILEEVAAGHRAQIARVLGAVVVAVGLAGRPVDVGDRALSRATHGEG